MYDHQKRELAERLVATGHEHHHSVLAAMHVHLDQTHCLEVVALRGRVKELKHLTEHMIGMKGVKHGKPVVSTTSTRGPVSSRQQVAPRSNAAPFWGQGLPALAPAYATVAASATGGLRS